MIFQDIPSFLDYYNNEFRANAICASFPLVATSGPLHLIHSGHTRLVAESAAYGVVVVIVNGDNFLIRKHGYCAVPLQERMELADTLRGATFVLPWDDGTQTVAGALEAIRPAYFCKGGDRTPANMSPEEVAVCEKIGCKIKYGVGGYAKTMSSSSIAKSVHKGLERVRVAACKRGD